MEMLSPKKHVTDTGHKIPARGGTGRAGDINRKVSGRHEVRAAVKDCAHGVRESAVLRNDCSRSSEIQKRHLLFLTSQQCVCVCVFA